jgi:hypothetical protein
VADTGNNRVLYFVSGSTTATRVYGQGGLFNTNIAATTVSGLSSPFNMALDSANGLFLTDYVNNRVLYFSSGSVIPSNVYGQGSSYVTSLSGTSTTSLHGPQGVCVDSANGIYGECASAYGCDKNR